VAGLCVLGSCARAAGVEPGLTVHRDGSAVRVDVGAPGGRALLEACEKRVAAANSVLRLAVTPELLRRLRENEQALEVDFGKPRVFQLGAPLERELRARRLLIPLTGELAGGMTTILWDDGGGYRAGPLRAEMPTDDLASLVEAAR
jgi:hypothetical protein